MEAPYIKRRRGDGNQLRLVVFVFVIATSLYFLYSLFPSPTEKRIESTMAANLLEATLSNFNTVFDKFKSQSPKNKANLILFVADKDPATNLSWCPDCVRAEPVIYKKVEEASDVALLTVYVGDRPTWRNPQHPFRVDEKFKLKGVPTLIRWENDQVKGRLEDHEAHMEHKIDALIGNN